MHGGVQMNNGTAMPFMTMVEVWGCRGRVELRGGHGGLCVIKVNQSEATNTAQIMFATFCNLMHIRCSNKWPKEIKI